jgi:dCMP deaminase
MNHSLDADAVTRVRICLAEVARRGTCRKRQVGACLLTPDGQILTAAANGTPPGITPCIDGGCVRCRVDGFKHGLGYDLCVCLHAEQSLLIRALRLGIPTAGCYLASSYQPCFMCAKLIVAAEVEGVLFDEAWHVPEAESGMHGLAGQYEAIWQALPGGCQRLWGALP